MSSKLYRLTTSNGNECTFLKFISTDDLHQIQSAGTLVYTAPMPECLYSVLDQWCSNKIEIKGILADDIDDGHHLHASLPRVLNGFTGTASCSTDGAIYCGSFLRIKMADHIPDWAQVPEQKGFVVEARHPDGKKGRVALENRAGVLFGRNGQVQGC